MADVSTRVLVLAGSPEGTRLARDLADRRGREILLAPLGEGAEPPFGGARVIRVGGYRDPADLVHEITRERIGAVVDASDPYDTHTARVARTAADAARVPRLVLCRPVWRRHPLDRRIEVDGLDGAAKVVSDVARRVLLALPERDVARFVAKAKPEIVYLARLERPPRWLRSGPQGHAPIDGDPSAAIEIDPGPYSRAGEAARLARHGIGTVVMRATGCDRLRPLLEAARAADLPVILIRRPWPVPGPRAETTADAAEWVEGDPWLSTLSLSSR